jgi:subtilase-type proteinase RRT12
MRLDTLVGSLKRRSYQIEVSAKMMRSTSLQSGAYESKCLFSYDCKDTNLGPYDYVYDSSAGKDVDIYIFDTGIDTSQKDFGGRAIPGVDYTGEGSGDNNGHGTCVAGVAGSQTYGVAKKANLIEVKTMDRTGRGKLSWVLSGLQFVLDNKNRRKHPAVVNMSLGSARSTVFNRAVEHLVSLGIPVIAAAGNSDASACRVSPASASGVFVLGAFDDRTDSVASFSNWGQCVDVFAPGVNVQSVSIRKDDIPVLYSGTSVSAPIGAGIVAYFMGMGDTGTGAVQRVSMNEYI